MSTTKEKDDDALLRPATKGAKLDTDALRALGSALVSSNPKARSGRDLSCFVSIFN